MFVLASNHRCIADTYMTVSEQRSQTSSFVGLTCKVSDKHVRPGWSTSGGEAA